MSRRGFSQPMVSASAVLLLVTFGAQASAGTQDFPLTKCSNTLVYTNPNPNECVEVHVWNLTSSPPNSSQTVTVAWSTGGSTPTDITPSANPLTIHCYISTIHAHEKQTSHSDHRVTSP